MCVMLYIIHSPLIQSGDNPVISFDAGELQAEVNRITAMGDPVASFLTSEEFTSVDPTEVMYDC